MMLSQWEKNRSNSRRTRHFEGSADYHGGAELQRGPRLPGGAAAGDEGRDPDAERLPQPEPVRHAGG